MSTIPKTTNENKQPLWKTLLGIVLVLITYYLGQVIATLVPMLLVNWTILASIISLILFVLTLALMFFICKHMGINLGEKANFKWWYVLLVLACPLINAAKDPLLRMLFNSDGNTANADSLVTLTQTLPITVLMGLSILFGPVAEEIIFRGIGINVFFKKHLVLGLLISCTLFSLVHTPTDLFSFFNYFIGGLIFGSVFVITKDLRWSIAGHVLNNAIFMILGLLMM